MSNSKLHKQQYRAAWENIPEFRGWLQPAPGNPFKAFCKICNRTITAHRIALFRHTSTSKHTKLSKICFIEEQNKNVGKTSTRYKPYMIELAGTDKSSSEDESANLYIDVASEPNEKENKIIIKPPNTRETVTKVQANDTDKSSSEDESSNLYFNRMNTNSRNKDKKENKLVIKPPSTRETVTKLQTNDTAGSDKSSSEDEASDLYFNRVNTNSRNMDKSADDLATITTQVLDTSKGLPVQNLLITLFKLEDGRWKMIKDCVTNPLGRCNVFISRKHFKPGRYKLHYDIERYYEICKQISIYPYIEIVFDVHSPNQNIDIPLILSPFGYTTYRGS